MIEVNELQKRRVIGKLNKHLGAPRGKTVALLGLAFKPDTDDMREASSLVLAARLQGEGAQVRAYDPIAAERPRPSCCPASRCAGSALEALEGADAVVLVTEWPEFAELDWALAAQADGEPAGGRRPQLPRRGGGARGRLHLRGRSGARRGGGRG